MRSTTGKQVSKVRKMLLIIPDHEDLYELESKILAHALRYSMNRGDLSGSRLAHTELTRLLATRDKIVPSLEAMEFGDLSCLAELIENRPTVEPQSEAQPESDNLGAAQQTAFVNKEISSPMDYLDFGVNKDSLEDWLSVGAHEAAPRVASRMTGRAAPDPDSRLYYNRLSAVANDTTELIHLCYIRAIRRLLQLQFSGDKAKALNPHDFRKQLRNLGIAYNVLFDASTRTDYDLRLLGLREPLSGKHLSVPEDAKTDLNGRAKLTLIEGLVLTRVLGTEALLDVVSAARLLPEDGFWDYLMESGAFSPVELASMQSGVGLLRQGVISVVQFEQAFQAVRSGGYSLADVLVNAGWVSVGQLVALRQSSTESAEPAFTFIEALVEETPRGGQDGIRVGGNLPTWASQMMDWDENNEGDTEAGAAAAKEEEAAATVDTGATQILSYLEPAEPTTVSDAANGSGEPKPSLDLNFDPNQRTDTLTTHQFVETSPDALAKLPAQAEPKSAAVGVPEEAIPAPAAAGSWESAVASALAGEVNQPPIVPPGEKIETKLQEKPAPSLESLPQGSWVAAVNNLLNSSEPSLAEQPKVADDALTISGANMISIEALSTADPYITPLNAWDSHDGNISSTEAMSSTDPFIVAFDQKTAAPQDKAAAAPSDTTNPAIVPFDAWISTQQNAESVEALSTTDPSILPYDAWSATKSNAEAADALSTTADPSIVPFDAWISTQENVAGTDALSTTDPSIVPYDAWSSTKTNTQAAEPLNTADPSIVPFDAWVSTQPNAAGAEALSTTDPSIEPFDALAQPAPLTDPQAGHLAAAAASFAMQNYFSGAVPVVPAADEQEISPPEEVEAAFTPDITVEAAPVGAQDLDPAPGTPSQPTTDLTEQSQTDTDQPAKLAAPVQQTTTPDSAPKESRRAARRPRSRQEAKSTALSKKMPRVEPAPSAETPVAQTEPVTETVPEAAQTNLLEVVPESDEQAAAATEPAPADEPVAQLPGATEANFLPELSSDSALPTEAAIQYPEPISFAPPQEMPFAPPESTADTVTAVSTAADTTATVTTEASVEGAPSWSHFKLWFGENEKALPLSGTVAKIGRNRQTVDIPIQEPAVSREHCQLELAADGVYVRDLLSRHGTFIIRGQEELRSRETAPLKLEHGDFIRLGVPGSPSLTWIHAQEIKESEKPNSSTLPLTAVPGKESKTSKGLPANASPAARYVGLELISAAMASLDADASPSVTADTGNQERAENIPEEGALNTEAPLPKGAKPTQPADVNTPSVPIQQEKSATNTQQTIPPAVSDSSTPLEDSSERTSTSLADSSAEHSAPTPAAKDNGVSNAPAKTKPNSPDPFADIDSLMAAIDAEIASARKIIDEEDRKRKKLRQTLDGNEK